MTSDDAIALPELQAVAGEEFALSILATRFRHSLRGLLRSISTMLTA